MVKVFIFGATGFVGFPMATALRRAGHHVYGLVRTPAKARLLAKSEITPVLGTIEDPSTWTPIIIAKEINVIIDTSGVGPESHKILQKAIDIGTARIKHIAGKLPRGKGPKLGYIYISGCWVHGDSPEPVGDLSVCGENAKVKPPAAVAWRPELEEKVLAAADVLDAVVVRPGLLFGGQGSILPMWFGPLIQAKKTGAKEVELVGRDTNLALIHRDDLADFQVRLVEKISFIAGLSYPVFDIVSCQEPLKNVIISAAKALGYTGGIKYRSPSNPFEEACLTNVNVSSERARHYLGWEPRHKTLSGNGEIDIYLQAIIAHMAIAMDE